MHDQDIPITEAVVVATLKARPSEEPLQPILKARATEDIFHLLLNRNGELGITGAMFKVAKHPEDMKILLDYGPKRSITQDLLTASASRYVLARC